MHLRNIRGMLACEHDIFRIFKSRSKTRCNRLFVKVEGSVLDKSGVAPLAPVLAGEVVRDAFRIFERMVEVVVARLVIEAEFLVMFEHLLAPSLIPAGDIL